MKFFTRTRVVAAAAFLLAISLVTFSQSVGAQTAWSCNGLPATIVGTPGPDTLRGSPGVDVIVAREGDDVITALGGDDVVCAGKGDDKIFGGDGFDIIFAAQGNDTIYAANGASAAMRVDSKGARMFGGAGNDTIHGSTKWDRMQGGLGADQLFGHEGRDWMRAGPDRDRVDGGAGIDDMHGGNGADMIEMTGGDIVRGGAGIDQCNIAVGVASRLLSCGLNQPEATKPVVQPQPVAPTTTTSTTTTSTTAAPAPTAARLVVKSCSARGETVEIKNEGGLSINLNGWILHDEGPRFEASLNGIVLSPGGSVIMLSGTDTADTANTRRWSDRNVWNNDGDTATLRQPGGAVASTISCS